MKHSCFGLALTLASYITYWKPHIKCEVLKHKFCKDIKSKAKLLHLFVCFSVMNAIFQMQTIKKDIAFDLHMKDFSQCQFNNTLLKTALIGNLKHVSE